MALGWKSTKHQYLIHILCLFIAAGELTIQYVEDEKREMGIKKAISRGIKMMTLLSGTSDKHKESQRTPSLRF